MSKNETDAGTLDLFGSFEVKKDPAKKMLVPAGVKPPLVEITIPGVETPKAPKSFNPERDVTMSIGGHEITGFADGGIKEFEPTKRDLEMSDQGWQREFIPHLNDFAYMSNSRIKKILESMAHFEWSYVKKIKSEETDSQRLGKIVHHAILEPDLFRKNHVIVPNFSGKGSVAAKKEFIQGLPYDAIILAEKEVDKILYMIDSVLGHPRAHAILTGASFELNGYSYDKRHDLWWLFKPDILKTTLVSDLKTTKSAKPDSFGKDIFNYGYYLQAAIYLDQASNLLGEKVDRFPFVVIENVAPHVCEVYKVPEYLIETGRQLVDVAIKQYKYHMIEWKKAEARGKRYRWPGYTGGDRVVEVDIPQWARYRLESNELAYLG